ncbi:hypothetical protein MD484_g4807, partial [Candolleomyces efflorescens]
MAPAQADKIRGKNDLWGVRMFSQVDPSLTAGDPPAAYILDLSEDGKPISYPMAMRDALSGKPLGPEDVDPNQKPRCFPQVMTREAPNVLSPTPETHQTFADRTAPAVPLIQPNHWNPNPQFLSPQPAFEFSRYSPQPSESEYSQTSNSSVYSNPCSPRVYGCYRDVLPSGGASAVGPSRDYLPMQSLPSSSGTGPPGMPALSMPLDHWQPWPDPLPYSHVILTYPQDAQDPTPFPLGHSVDVTSVQAAYPIPGPYADPNIAMAPQTPPY